MFKTAIITTAVAVASLAIADPAIAAPSSLTDCPLLLEGQTSPCVQLLQVALNDTNAAYRLAEDGHFGAGTRIALLDFQGRNGLPADGNAGPTTLRELASRTASATVPNSYVTPNDSYVDSPRPQESNALAVTDDYLFQASIQQFLMHKRERANDELLNWSDDGCSVPQAWKDYPGGFNFRDSCLRHDFGYRNYKAQNRLTEANRLRIDKQFKDDLNRECKKSRGVWAARGVECRQYANTYYKAVRRFG